MSLEKLENGMAKLTVEVSAEQLDAAIKTAYNKNKGKFSIPGFRKGKVPQAMVEKMYGVEVFYEDAINELLGQTYPKAAEECGEEIVSRPEIDVVSIEKGKGLVYTATVALKPVVTLGEYKGLEVEVDAVDVTDEEVDARIKTELEKQGRSAEIETEIAKDDTAVIDFKGYVDGVAFEGGEGEDYELKIGSGSFIDTFEDQLIGKKAGDAVEVNVTFPENYPAEDLAGKAAKFDVVIKKVVRTEIPELTDALVDEISEFDTVDAYKADIREKLMAGKVANANAEKQAKLIAKAAENATMILPEVMVKERATSMVNDFARQLQQQGLSMEQYQQFTGATLDKMVEQMMPEAEKRIKESLTLEAIIDAEKLEATEEKIEERLTEMGKQYNMDAEAVKEALGQQLEAVKEDMTFQMAIDLIVAEAK